MFLKLGLDALLLEARQIVDEDFALEVIHFVLDANRQELVCDAGERLSVQIERANGDALGALDRLVDSGNRQAAFLTLLGAFPADNFRVDQNQELVPALGGIDDDHPLVHVDLRCRQTHPGCGVHGFSHVSDQGANRFVNLRDRGGLPVQPRIGIVDDV